MLELGLREFHESQDQMPGCADVPIGFASVMAEECFEVIGELTDEMIHNDLSQGTLHDFQSWKMMLKMQIKLQIPLAYSQHEILPWSFRLFIPMFQAPQNVGESQNFLDSFLSTEIVRER